MFNTLRFLTISANRQLREELADAFVSFGEGAPTAEFAPELHQALSTARVRPPHVVLIELKTDMQSLKSAVQSISSVAPAATIVAAFQPDMLADNISEGELVISALHAGVKDFLRRPVSSVELQSLLHRAVKPHAIAESRNGAVLAFLSNKGGVGKSTLAVNTACGLAQRYPERVLLIDASLQMGVAASMLDLSPVATLADVAAERDRLDATLLRQLATPHESGLHLLAAPPDAVAAAGVDDEVIARVVSLARQSYDYVVVDTFPLIDAAVVAVLDACDRAYLIVENVVPTLQGAAKLIGVLDDLNFAKDKRRLILNRYTRISGSLPAADVAARLGMEVYHVVPYDRRVVTAANIGQPFVLSSGRFNRTLRRFRALVDDADSVRIAVRQNRADTNGFAGKRNGDDSALGSPDHLQTAEPLS